MKRFVLEMLGCAAFAGALAGAERAWGDRAQRATAELPTPASPVHTWLVDPEGHVDGVLLEDGRSFYFPSEDGRTILMSFRIGDPVRIDVTAGRRHLVDERDGSTVDITPMARGGGPGAQYALERLTARGRITAFLRNEGAINGFILDSGEQVRVPSALGVRLNALRLGDMVTVDGFGRQGPMGTGMMATRVIDPRGAVVLER